MTALLAAENEELKAEVKRLALRVKSLEKELYGSRADRRKPEDPNQTTFSEVEEATAGKTAPPKPLAPARKERKGGKKGPRPINPDLPRVEERIADPDLKELICPVTGNPMKPVFEEKIEVLARKPAEYWVRVIVRQVFASPEGDAMAYSPWPAEVMPRSRIDASVVGSILCARLADHQPYNRQSDQLARHGVKLDRGTIGSLVRLAEENVRKSPGLRANRAHGQNADAQGDPLPARPHRTAARMLPARAVTDRQQYCRERPAPDQTRSQELALHRPP